MSRSVAIPSDRVYWAVVEPIAGRALGQDEVATLAEDVLPLSLEALHIVQRRLKDGRVIVCAIEPDELGTHITPRTLEAVPELPDFIADTLRDELEPPQFNLLEGAFMPPEIARASRTLTASFWSIAAVLAIVVSAGFIARGLAARNAIATVDERRSEIVLATLAAGGKRQTEHPGVGELRLLAELRELQSTRSTSIPRLDDIAPLASAALVRWPAEVDARLDQARVTTRSIVLEGHARDAAEAQRIADAVGALAGARLEPPQVRATNDGVTFSITLTPGSGTPAPGTRPGDPSPDAGAVARASEEPQQ